MSPKPRLFTAEWVNSLPVEKRVIRLPYQLGEVQADRVRRPDLKDAQPWWVELGVRWRIAKGVFFGKYDGLTWKD